MTWKTYPKYKDSGIEWLGKVPERWEVKALKRDTIVKRGASPRPIDDPKYFDDDGEYAWVRISDVTATSNYLEETTQKLSYLGASLSVKLSPGKLFLSIAGTVGKPCITQIKCCIHDGFVYFPNLSMLPKFLFYIFAGGEAYKGLGKHGTQLNLNTDTVGWINIPFPPTTEQQQIISFLDEQTARIDELIAKKERQIELLKEKRSALISHAVTKGLDPNAKMKDSGIEWLGKVPERWEVKALKRDTIVKRGASPRPIDDPKYFDDDGEYAWVRISDVTATSNYLEETTQKLSYLGASLSVKLSPGKLFLSIAGTVGKPCITQIKCCIHDGFVYFPNLSMLPKFLFYIFAGGEAYKGLGKHGTQLNLNTDTVGWINIPFPPTTEQQQIISFLDEQTARIDELIAKIGTSIEKLREYRSAVISAAVTGKIDVREFC